MTDRPTLPEALLRAQLAVRPVAKTGTNTAQGWRFLEAHEVVKAARDALLAAGLVAVVRTPADEPFDPHVLRTYLHLQHPASGEEAKYPIDWPVERPGPQARRAAWTYSTKQLMLQLLAVPEPGDDPETTAEPAASQPQGKRRKAGAVHGPAPMSDPQRRMLWATARRAGYGDPAELAAWAAGRLGLDLDAGDPQQLLGSLTRQEASTLLDQLQQVQPAERLDGPDPADPWASHPVAPIPGGQADQ